MSKKPVYRATKSLYGATALGSVCVATALVVGLTGGNTGGEGRKEAGSASSAPRGGAATDGADGKKPEEEKWDGKVHVLGDGSTSYTGPQPNVAKPEKLKPGEKPPQFVVFSWDGALENDDKLFSHFRQVAKANNAQMTYFLTGIYLLPKADRKKYLPPRHDAGEAAIDFTSDAHIKDTLEQLSGAWREGNEIGTHFNGHFCGKGGGGEWTMDEWKKEIEQSYSFVQNWKTNTGFKNLDPLPFDYKKELVGGRAPCLEGQKTLIPAAKEFGWRYDASSPGDFQLWPSKIDGIWNFPLQLLPYPNTDRQVLSMDFNFLYNQSGDNTNGDPAKRAEWQKLTREGYLNGFERVYNGSRAPLFIGNHFETWNGGIYMKAMEDVMKSVCRRDGVRCVSFRQVADWLDAQDPKVLAKLRILDPAQAPDWKTFIK
ncbi:hypothetical protein AB0K89_11785 [Streptomyces cinnamoneus]|uniref:hypothetical protein n=1 Tax=Streptomyces cinnamoneus TaxID=53446 RepID=UPI00342FE9DC